MFLNRIKKMAKIVINGIEYFSDTSISINGDTVTVDGIEQNTKIPNLVEIRVLEGTIQNLITDRSVTCGDVLGNIDAGGSVNCDDVEGNITAGGSVNCDDVEGDISAGGSVNCDDVKGSINAPKVRHG